MKDFKEMKPREVESYLRQVILDTFGDKVENASTVSASHGYYYVGIETSTGTFYNFVSFRKKDAGKIAKAIRVLK